jgi:hypothetical protein
MDASYDRSGAERGVDRLAHPSQGCRLLWMEAVMTCTPRSSPVLLEEMRPWHAGERGLTPIHRPDSGDKCRPAKGEETP